MMTACFTGDKAEDSNHRSPIMELVFYPEGQLEIETVKLHHGDNYSAYIPEGYNYEVTFANNITNETWKWPTNEDFSFQIVTYKDMDEQEAQKLFTSEYNTYKFVSEQGYHYGIGNETGNYIEYKIYYQDNTTYIFSTTYPKESWDTKGLIAPEIIETLKLKNSQSDNNSENIGDNNYIYEMYKKAIEIFCSSSFSDAKYVKYGLFDIDNNGIPELILNDGSHKYTVYTCLNNNIKTRGCFDSMYGLYTYDKMLLTSSENTGYKKYTQVLLEGTIGILPYPFLSSENLMPVSNDTIYTHNGKEISDKEYMKINNKINTLDMYSAANLEFLEIVKQ